MPSLAQFIQRLVKLKHFFQQLRRSLLFVLTLAAHAGTRQQVLDAAYGISKRSKGIVQLRGTRQRHFPFALAAAHEIVGMQLPAQLVKTPLEIFRIDSEFARQSEESEIVGIARKRLDLPASHAKMGAIRWPATTPAGRLGSFVPRSLRCS